MCLDVVEKSLNIKIINTLHTAATLLQPNLIANVGRLCWAGLVSLCVDYQWGKLTKVEMRAFIVYNDLLGNLVKQCIEQRRLRNTERIHVTVCYRYMDGVWLHTVGKAWLTQWALSIRFMVFWGTNFWIAGRYLQTKPVIIKCHLFAVV